MKIGQRLWTKNELILAMNLYCKTPFGKIHKNNPDIIKLSELIERTSSSVTLKLSNFASLDPSLQARGIKGSVNSSKLDKEVWNDYYNNWDILPYESEELLAKLEHTTVEALNHIPEIELIKDGKTREQLLKVRVNQNFFRCAILSAYNNKCCITGLSEPNLLIAGHIRPWGIDEKNRLNPRNGLALNALHDKAFESGYITITPDYKIKISPLLMMHKDGKNYDFFGRYNDKSIILPSRFLPDPEFLKYHNNERFKL